MLELTRCLPTDPSALILVEEYLDEREATFPSVQGSYRRSAAQASDFAEGAGAFFVVGDGDELLGCGGVRLIDTAQRGRCAEIKHVFTRPRARGRGVARALMARLAEAAEELGATELVLDTNDSLAAAANLYRALGFVRIEPYNVNPNATAWYAKPVTAAGD